MSMRFREREGRLGKKTTMSKNPFFLISFVVKVYNILKGNCDR